MGTKRTSKSSTAAAADLADLQLACCVASLCADPPTTAVLWNGLRGHISQRRDAFADLMWHGHETGVILAVDPDDGAVIVANPVPDTVMRRDDIEWMAGRVKVDDPGLLAKAQRIAKTIMRVPKAREIRERQDEILRHLAPHRAVSVSDLMTKLGLSSQTRRRMLQRDLLDLERNELAIRTPDNEWRAVRDELAENLARMALATAMETLEQIYRDVLPADIQRSMQELKKRSKKAIKALPKDDPRARWFNAMRIARATHPLGRQRILPDVRLGIERAILEQRKIRLTWHHYYGPEGIETRSTTGTVSHILLHLPGEAEIVFWADDPKLRDWYPLPRLGMELIDHVELLDEDAESTAGYEPSLEPPSGLIMEYPREPHGLGVVVRMTKNSFLRLSDRMIAEQWKVITRHDDGDVTVSIDARADIPLDEFLKQPGVVAVRPKWLGFFRRGQIMDDKKLMDRSYPEYLHYEKLDEEAEAREKAEREVSGE